MNTILSDKVVVITGASSGIGKAIAIVFAKAGASVVVASRNQSTLDEVVTEIKKDNGKAMAVVCDVTIETDCKNLIQETIKNYQKIDILVCNAGISMRSLFLDVDLNVMKQIMDTNFWGSVYCTKYALPYILKTKGSIVAVSSITGKKGLPARTAYTASKFALEGFMETLRSENSKNNLHVLVARPGFTDTNIRKNAMNAKGDQQGESPLDESSLMSSEEVAVHILKAVQSRKRELVLTATGKAVIILNKFFPKLVDKLVYRSMAKEKASPFKDNR
jgi:short-subunit dehydrogenase